MHCYTDCPKDNCAAKIFSVTPLREASRQYKTQVNAHRLLHECDQETHSAGGGSVTHWCDG